MLLKRKLFSKGVGDQSIISKAVSMARSKNIGTPRGNMNTASQGNRFDISNLRNNVGKFFDKHLRFGGRDTAPSPSSPKKRRQKIDTSGYQKGDLLIADRGAMKHYGVWMGDGTVVEYGSDTHDPRMASRRRVSIRKFKGNSPISNEAPSGIFNRDEILERASSAVGTDHGGYNLRNNNCEHFARDIVNGDRTSTQVTSRLSKFGNKNIDILKNKLFPGLMSKKFSDTNSVRGTGPALVGNQINQLKTNLLNSDLIFKARKNLTPELGGMNHFDKNQTQYLSGAGSILGAGIGAIRSKRKAKKKAKKYGLKKGTLDYDEFVKNNTREGFLKGAAVGGAVGFGASKGIDAYRGKEIAGKIRQNYGELKNNKINYFKFGKNMRGINSEEQVNNIMNNWKEVSDYAKSGLQAL